MKSWGRQQHFASMDGVKDLKQLTIVIMSLITLGTASGCTGSDQTAKHRVEQSNLTNPQMRVHPFLQTMSNDGYFPDFLVEKGKTILVELCFQIEADNPKTNTELFRMTHAAAKKFDALQDEFIANGSEIETVATEAIVLDYAVVAAAYGLDAPLELVIGPAEFW